MLPTPETSHVSFANVYEPAEDSFLLLDALSQPSETLFLTQRFSAPRTSPAPLVLEVGTGSGVVLAFLARHAAVILGRPDALALATDVNRFACRGAAQTVRRALSVADPAAVFGGCVQADLASPLRAHAVDLLVFNPPYVPSEAAARVQTADGDGDGGEGELGASARAERDWRLLALATDGGDAGMEVTDRLLAQLPRVLDAQRGVAYVLLCAQNRPEEVKARVRRWGSGWAADTVRTSGKQAGWERLQVVRISRGG